nr:MAG TPA: hypothetical protein [Caudoviricetes sp.]
MLRWNSAPCFQETVEGEPLMVHRAILSPK